MAKALPVTINGKVIAYVIECPACKCSHEFYTNCEGRPKWSFDDNVESPTFSPSMLVRGQLYPSGNAWPTDDEYRRMRSGEQLKMKPTICHSYVSEGKIQYLNDCTHSLAGKTVELPEM
jgi:hypothetical protein